MVSLNMQNCIKDLHSLVADILKFCFMYHMINFDSSDDQNGSVKINNIFINASFTAFIFDVSLKDFSPFEFSLRNTIL